MQIPSYAHIYMRTRDSTHRHCTDPCAKARQTNRASLHWGKSWIFFEEKVYFISKREFLLSKWENNKWEFLLSKWENISPFWQWEILILRKIQFFFAQCPEKNTDFTPNFLIIFPVHGMGAKNTNGGHCNRVWLSFSFSKYVHRDFRPHNLFLYTAEMLEHIKFTFMWVNIPLTNKN